MPYRNPNTKKFAKATKTQCVVKDQTPEQQQHEMLKRIQHGKDAATRRRKAIKARKQREADRKAKRRDKAIRSKKGLGEFSDTFRKALGYKA